MSGRGPWFMCAGVVFVVAASSILDGQQPSFYAASQVRTGRGVYQRACASCHGRTLDEGNGGPPLKGEIFQERWNERTVAELFDLVSRSMPPTAERDITSQEYADLIAFLLQSNGVPAGRESLKTDLVSQEHLVLRFK